MSYRKLALTSIALILILSGVYSYNFHKVHIVEGVRCTLDQGKCQLKTVFGSVQFESVTVPILVEEEIPIKIALEESMRLKAAWIEGINMYMGKIPVIIRK